jgi:CDP-paratose 2-epimerase
MKVLITGGCGFLGTNLALFYKEKGAEVIAFDSLAKHEFKRIPYIKPKARAYNKETLEKANVKVVVGDIRDYDLLLKHSQGFDYLCHTAAQPAMTISWEDPVLDFTTNTQGTFHVLEVARKLKIPVAICSSVHTYGPDHINSLLKEEKTRYVRNPKLISEKDPLLQGVVTPLHASKRANEIYAQSYIDTYNMDVACFRLTGIYGPNQFGGEDHGWVANFTFRTFIGEPLTIFGTGKQLRDILYASDVCEAFDAFYKKRKSGIFVIGGGEGNMISLLESIDLIGKITGRKAVIKFEKDRFGDLRYFVSDCSKFTKATGWKPKVRPEQGIKKLFNWVKINENLFIKKK